MPAPIINNSDWDLPPSADRVFSIRISRNTLIAFLVSILLHLALLWIFAPKLFTMGSPIKEAPPFEITLSSPQQQQSAKAEATTAPAQPQLEQPVKPQKPKPIKQQSVPPKQIKPEQAPPKLPVETAKKSDFSLPKPIEKPVEISPDPLPGEDMQAYIKRQKEAKLAQQGASKQDVEELLASSSEPSAGSKRDAKIKENLKFDGSNGIFQIREMGLHHAQFSFKGWKNNINTARLEVVDVDVPDGSDGKHEIIQKMIEIIRREYSGDFNWESQRLGRVLVLSARVEDTQALESFMMSEFFASNGNVRRY